MSNELETKMTDHVANEFFGGDARGMCVQITAAKIDIRESVEDQLQEEGFIQLTMEEAAALCNTLSGFITKEAMRRQSLLREQIKHLKNMEKTVFKEVADLEYGMFEIPLITVDFVAKFCPKVGW